MLKRIVLLAGLRLQLTLQNDITSLYLRKYYIESIDDTEEPKLVVPPVDSTHILNETIRLGCDHYFAEYSLLVEPIANLLLLHDRFLFHAAAFLWHGKAFLLTAPSGVGKSTQLQNWMNIFPDEIEVINGDKPIIEKRDKEFIVHPSPWNGKENWSGSRAGLLGGIILLERGTEDRIYKIGPKEAAYPLFLQFLYLSTDIESLNLVCGYEEKMLQSVPIWKLTNTGTASSAILTHQKLIEEGL